MPFIIKQPETEEEFRQYYHLRWQILRAPWGQPQGSEIDNMEQQCIHVMAVDTGTDIENSVIGVARLQFNSATEAQLRYMAVSGKYQGKGIGHALHNALQQHARRAACRTIVLDAREPALGFYQKLGYGIAGKSYLLFGEIQHYRMIKNLDRVKSTDD